MFFVIYLAIWIWSFQVKRLSRCSPEYLTVLGMSFNEIQGRRMTCRYVNVMCVRLENRIHEKNDRNALWTYKNNQPPKFAFSFFSVYGRFKPSNTRSAGQMENHRTSVIQYKYSDRQTVELLSRTR